jgi:hypothetical protein
VWPSGSKDVCSDSLLLPANGGRSVPLSFARGIIVVKEVGVVRPVKWVPTALGIRVNIARDSFVDIALVSDSRVPLSSTDCVEVVGGAKAPQAVEGNGVQLLRGEDVSRHPLVSISQICHGIVALRYTGGVEVVASFCSIHAEKRDGVRAISTGPFDKCLGFG